MLIDCSDLGYILEITAREDEWATKGAAAEASKASYICKTTPRTAARGVVLREFCYIVQSKGLLLLPPLAYEPWALSAGSYAKNAL